MRARVLVTNGEKTIDLFWVRHDGKDVYCGLSNADIKQSYHASGKVHTKLSGEQRQEGQHFPLSKMKGYFQLESISIDNIDQFINHMSPNWDFSGKKSDATLLVDTRSVPQSVRTYIPLGLVEPGEGRLLNELLSRPSNIKDVELKPQISLFATSVTPWIYATVY